MTLWKDIRLQPKQSKILGLILFLAATSWIGVWIGKSIGPYAWLIGVFLATPFFGIIFALGEIIYSIVKRRISIFLPLSIVLALAASIPMVGAMLGHTWTYPACIDSTKPHLIARLPSNLPLHTEAGGNEACANQHVMSPSNRWAYDFVIEPTKPSSEKLEDYPCYGSSIVSPVDGIIATVVDGVPDHLVGDQYRDHEHLSGNFLTIETKDKTHLMIAHFQNNSIAVKPGEQVSEGQFLGRCGNSGNTDAPHIHIHHQRGNPNTMWAMAFGQGLPLFFRDHDGKPMPVGIGNCGGKELRGDIVKHQI